MYRYLKEMNTRYLLDLLTCHYCDCGDVGQASHYITYLESCRVRLGVWFDAVLGCRSLWLLPLVLWLMVVLGYLLVFRDDSLYHIYCNSHLRILMQVP